MDLPILAGYITENTPKYFLLLVRQGHKKRRRKCLSTKELTIQNSMGRHVIQGRLFFFNTTVQVNGYLKLYKHIGHGDGDECTVQEI